MWGFGLAWDRTEVFRNHIGVYENCIKVLDRIQESYKSARLLNLNPHSRKAIFNQKRWLKTSITGMKVYHGIV